MAASWCRRAYLVKNYGIKLRYCLQILSHNVYNDKVLCLTQGNTFSNHHYSALSGVPKKGGVDSSGDLPVVGEEENDSENSEHVEDEPPRKQPRQDAVEIGRDFQAVNVSHPIEKTHDPKTVEDGWYDWWTSQGFFTPSLKASQEKDKFVVLLPPPNVTGTLHLGHALTSSIQDALVRWHRMRGKATLWIPGTDHAGIATHAVVEKRVWRQQQCTRHDLGKEKFVQEIWNFKELNEKEIKKQMKRLGCSLDWSREYFTMNKPLSRTVTEAFCQLYEKGLIYQAERLVNWSCAFRSSVSDIEVDNVKLEKPTILSVPGESEGVEFGTISSFAYPVADSDEKITVSTTRLETMLADTAVAVHPNDPRYNHLIGKHVIHPLDKGRLIPVIADLFVDMNFGHGAVKITPGHDHIDFDVGRRHNLDVMEILNDDGTMKEDIPVIGGLTRFQARRKVQEVLSHLGLYHGDREHPTVLPLCSRSGDVIEPRLKTQWYLNCKGMAERALEAVEEGRLRLIPDYNKKIWNEWLSDIRDWCLSRQLWWGHQIPVYYCKTSGKSVCARTKGEARKQLATELDIPVDCVEVIQDGDVLDTWFSSGLLPFSALGWPDRTQDLQCFFPNTLLETGQDILFFWVARMTMMSSELMDELPFQTVLLHGMLRDAHGRKMSKSLGNVIDPLDVVEGISLQDLYRRLESGNLDPREIETAKVGQKKDFPKGIGACGADALRFTLCSYNVKNMDINFNVEHAESKRRFCNKIWQSFKFIFHHLGPDFMAPSTFQLSGHESGTDLWILSRLSHMVKACDQHFPLYNLHIVCGALQTFWYHEVCDVYLEAVKPILSGIDVPHKNCVQNVLFMCANTFIRAASPFMPFLCEELYQRLSFRGGKFAESVSIAEYPHPTQHPWFKSEIEVSMKTIQEMVFHVQKLRKDYNIMGSKSDLFILTDNTDFRNAVSQHKDCLLALSRSGKVTMLHASDPIPRGCTSSRVNQSTRICVMVKGNIDVDKELARLCKRQDQLRKGKEKLQLKLDKLTRKGRAQSFEALKIREKMEKIDTELTQISGMASTLLTSQDES